MLAHDEIRLGLGTWQNTDPEQCAESVRTALETGYRHIDTAQAYDNESYVGDGIEAADVDREDVFLATKVSSANLRRDEVIETTEESLERLGTDYVDLLYIHWPTNTYDPEATLPALDRLYEEGKARNIGVSNFTPSLIEEADEILDAPIFANQVEMHPKLRQDHLVEYAQDNDMWVVAYSPLARGEVFDIEVIERIAQKHDASPAQVSLAWLLSRDNVAAIPKATSAAHIRDNWAAPGVTLDEHDIERIEHIEQERLFDSDDVEWELTPA